jgi:hypothetical protein
MDDLLERNRRQKNPARPDAAPGGGCAHGPPKERFLYLSWRNANGAYAQRLKLPLGAITWSDIDSAQTKPILGDVAVSNRPRAPGGTNVGGTRAVAWKPSDG